MGVASGQAFRSYACRPYTHWPVSAAILNAKFVFNYKFVAKRSPFRGLGATAHMPASHPYKPVSAIVFLNL